MVTVIAGGLFLLITLPSLIVCPIRAWSELFLCVFLSLLLLFNKTCAGTIEKTSHHNQSNVLCCSIIKFINFSNFSVFNIATATHVPKHFHAIFAQCHPPCFNWAHAYHWITWNSWNQFVLYVRMYNNPLDQNLRKPPNLISKCNTSLSTSLWEKSEPRLHKLLALDASFSIWLTFPS